MSLLFRARGDTSDARQAFSELRESVSSDVEQIQEDVGNAGEQGGGSLSKLTAFAGDMGEAFTTAGGMVATASAVVVAFGAAALAVGKQMYDLAEAAREVVSEIDKFQKLTNLSIDSIQALKIAAESTGDSLDTITEVWESFSEQIIEAARGDEEATEKLTRNKINAKTAINDLEGTFTKAIKTINDMPPGFRQNAAAMDLMGDSGLDMIPIVRAMDGDLKGFAKTLKDQGMLIDSEGIKKTDLYGKQMKDLELRFAALKTQMGIEFMPALIELGRVAKDFLVTNKNDIIEWGKSITQWVSAAIKNVQMWAAIMKDLKAGDYTLTNYMIAAQVITNQEQANRDRQMTEEVEAELEARRQKNQQSGKYDWTETEENKKKRAEEAEKRRKEQEEAAKRDISALLKMWQDYGDSLNKVFDDTFKSYKEALEKSGDTEGFKQKVVELNNWFIEERGRAEVELNFLENSQAEIEKKSALEREALLREQIKREQATKKKASDAIAETEKVASETSVKNTEAEQTRKNELVKAANETRLRGLERDLKLGAITELDYANAVAEIRKNALEQEKAQLEESLKGLDLKGEKYAEITQKIKVLDEELARQLIENADNVRETVENLMNAKDPFNGEEGTPRPDAAPKATGGIFGGMVESLKEFFNLAKELPTLSSVFTDFAGILTGAFQGVAQAVGSLVENWVLMGETGPAMLRKILASALATIAAESAVKAIFQLAEGFAALFWNPPAAAAHFTAAALYGSIAGVAAIAGRAVAGDAFKRQTSGGYGDSAQSRNSSGGEVYSSNRNAQIINMSRNMSASVPQQSLVIESKGGLSFDELFVIRYQSNRRGGIRDVIRKDNE